MKQRVLTYFVYPLWYLIEVMAFVLSMQMVGACSQSASAASGAGALPVKKTEFTIHRGVNISQWLYVTGKNACTMEEHEFQQLKDWGFDFIRLPIGEVPLFHDDGTLNADTLQLLEDALRWCQKYDLRVVLDLHITRSHEYIVGYRPLFNSEADQQRLCAMWTTLTRRLKEYPADFMAFEILNEPAADTDEQWNAVARKVVRAIRALDKERVIVLSCNKWADVRTLPSLWVPENDPNVMLTFHFYEPMLLTHYLAAWRDDYKVQLSGVKYPGQPVSDEEFASLAESDKCWIAPYMSVYNQDWMHEYWRAAVDFARAKGVPLYLGEFGCLPSVGEKARLNWVRDVVALCEEYGIPRSSWEYKSAFGFCGWRDGKLKNEALLKALMNDE